MAKKRVNKISSRKPTDEVCRVTGRMPEWMQEYLAAKGIEGEFNFAKLTKEQCAALDLAERLLQKEMNGLIRVTYDPKRDPEPQAELTDYAENEYRQKPPETDEDDADSATQEMLDDENESGEDAKW